MTIPESRFVSVTRKPTNANPGLKVKRGFHLARQRWFKGLQSKRLFEIFIHYNYTQSKFTLSQD